MSPKVKKIIETINKMGVMSEDIRSVYKDMVDEMVDDLSEEELDELSKSTLGRYAKKAGSEREKSFSKAMRAKDTDKSEKEFDKHYKRKRGMEKAIDKLSKK